MTTETILIVEDDGILAFQLVQILTKQGYTVPDPVATGEEAINVALSIRPDLILMDIQLAGEMDGIDAAEQICASIDTSVLFLTGFSQTSLVERAKQIGPYGYLLKPVSPKELVATVKTILFKHKLDLQLKAEKDSLESSRNELQRKLSDRAIDMIIANNLLRVEVEDRKRREKILEIGLELSEFAKNHDIGDLVLKIIDTIEAMTGSSVGFFHFLDSETAKPSFQCWSTRTRAGCTVSETEESGHDFLDPKGLLAQCIQNRKPATHHELDFAGHPNCWQPQGHPKLTKMLTVPIVRSDRVVAFLGVGNKRMLYDDQDINTASSLANIAWDIVLRKMAEDRMAESEAMLRMTLDGISDPILVINEQGKIIRGNRAFGKYYGIPEEASFSNRFCFELRGNQTPCEGCQRPFHQLAGLSGHFERKGLVYSDRIERIFMDTVRNASGNVEATIIRISDITQIRLMDRQLIQSEKLASLGTLVAGIAHEINNPNNFIVFNIPVLRSYMEFLLTFTDDHAERHPDFEAFGRPYPDFRKDCFNLLQNISHGSQRINQIVSNLRDFVRDRGTGSNHPVDIRKMVEQTLSICMGRIKKTVRNFESDIAAELPVVVTDSQAVEQIMVNLLINAAQACDKTDSWVRLKVLTRKQPPKELVIEVEDNGCGMDERTRQKIFEPFFTTKAVGEGTGLGLSICYRLMQELGGHIDVRSIEGQGSLFRVRIPVSIPGETLLLEHSPC
ncbi:ATP-binding protein [Desulfatirhabdium butyrativorans]|uniref:ATP-binding protein n=1 Tax=Desulfatirhabdium butyrativorans TaxID=340467 RepID=UPI000411E949|nr:ATP-binding protein [Desulfatirhabdium butyrativorans]